MTRARRLRVVPALLASGMLAVCASAGAQGVPRPTSDSLATRSTRVRGLIARERWSDALAALGPLERDSAGHALAARLAVNAGLTALHGGDTALAQGYWERAVREDPSVSEGPTDLAALHLARGQRDLARQVASRGLRAAPGQPRLLAIRAATIADTADYRDVLEQARAWHARAPRDAGLALEYAGLLAGSRRLDAAALYDSLVRTPGAPEAAYAAAVAFWAAGGRFDVAERVADSALAHHRGSGALWLEKGRVETRLRHWRDAAGAYQRAARLLPDPEAAELPLMDAEAALGDTAAAVSILRGMAARGAPRAALLAAAGRAADLGDAAAADSVYRRLLRRSPDDVSALEGAAALAAAHGDTAGAVALYGRELAVDSGGPWAPVALLRLERPAADRARRLLLAAEWRGLAALQRTELAAVGGTPAVADDRDRLLALVRTVLDTIVFRTAWGPEELVQLERAYPGSPLLERYAAELAARRGEDSTSLARYDELVRGAPADTALQRERAAVLERVGRSAEARVAYGRVLDLDPADTAAFRALVRLDERNGTLDDLLAQVRRLRVRLPDSRVVAEHEIEVLQRLGRLTEAAAAARRLEGPRP